jgi:excisionase family DNA binding protein
MKVIEAVEPEAEFLSLAAFMQRTGVSLSTVYRMFEHGELRSVSVGRRRLIPASELARLNSAGAFRPYVKRKAKSSGRQ